MFINEVGRLVIGSSLFTLKPLSKATVCEPKILTLKVDYCSLIITLALFKVTVFILFQNLIPNRNCWSIKLYIKHDVLKMIQILM